MVKNAKNAVTAATIKSQQYAAVTTTNKLSKVTPAMPKVLKN